MISQFHVVCSDPFSNGTCSARSMLTSSRILSCLPITMACSFTLTIGSGPSAMRASMWRLVEFFSDLFSILSNAYTPEMSILCLILRFRSQLPLYHAWNRRRYELNLPRCILRWFSYLFQSILALLIVWTSSCMDRCLVVCGLALFPRSRMLWCCEPAYYTHIPPHHLCNDPNLTGGPLWSSGLQRVQLCSTYIFLFFLRY